MEIFRTLRCSGQHATITFWLHSIHCWIIPCFFECLLYLIKILYLITVTSCLYAFYPPKHCLFFFNYFFICSEFCHTLKWNSHGFTCVPHPDHSSHLPLHPLPLGLPSAPGPSACLMHPTWAGDLFHPR